MFELSYFYHYYYYWFIISSKIHFLESGGLAYQTVPKIGAVLVRLIQFGEAFLYNFAVLQNISSIKITVDDSY